MIKNLCGRPCHGGTRHITKALFVMKLIVFLLTAAFLNVHANGISQTVSLSVKKTPLKKVFSLIQDQTGYSFIYTSNILQGKQPVTIDVKNRQLKEVLDLVLQGQQLRYVIESKTINIYPASPVVELSTSNQGADTSGILPLVHGMVVNERREPVEGVTVLVKGSSKRTLTDLNGSFSLKSVSEDAILVFSHISMETFELKVGGRSDLAITLKAKVSQLNDVTVLVNTGYQTISKERAPGSFVKIDNELLSRSVSTNILDRIDGVTSGLLFNRTKIGNNSPDISIRGRSTLFANAEPLIVLDNFPYTGELDNINPNDIESITVLKDATAASIWGALAGNGVIVITTKKGKLNQAPAISMNANVTLVDVPDLFYKPQLSSGEFIDVERFLFDKGKYTATINTGYDDISPVIALLVQHKAGSLSNAELESKLNALRSIDARNGLEKYFYRRAVNQQYALHVSGGGAYQSYFLSAGLDRNTASTLGSNNDRFTLNAKNTYYAFNRKLEISSGVLFAFSKTRSITQNYNPLVPYEQVADEAGNALAVVKDYRKSYIDTAGGGRLLDWAYRPLNERESDYTKELVDYRINLDLTWHILPSLKASLTYQYGKGNSGNNTYHDINSYYTRDLINRFSSIQGGTVTRPVPLGDILLKGMANYKNSYLRGQLNYDKTFNHLHNLTVIAGAEIKDYTSQTSSLPLLGYDPETTTDIKVDNFTYFPQYYDNSRTARIGMFSGQGELVDRFRSFYGNAAYSFDNKYVVSVSGRRDESNLFGVKTNQKGVPLWSAGISWNVSRENFYTIAWLPLLKLRLTSGYSGNVDKSTSAYTTVSVVSSPNSYGAIYGNVMNPPNPALRWEKVYMVNGGVDFAFVNNIVTGSLDYYVKNGKDLIGNGPIAAQTGLTTFKGNVADLRTTGVDVVINTKNLNGPLKWVTNFLFNYSMDIVTDYKVLQASNSSIVTANFLNPVEGKPYSALFSYPWAGLDTVGDPQGFLGGKASKDYTAITKSTNVNDMVYSGPGMPTIFGSVRNTLSWKQFDLSCNITYKAGYYFRRPVLNYTDLFAGNFRQADFANRWMKRGDEAITNVPAMIYPANSSRDALYIYSEPTIEKGDHIRLQDVQLSYTWNGGKKLPFKNVRLNFYARNLGILWKSTGSGWDPDALTGLPAPKSFSMALTASF